jgi:hypothetical protein
MDSIWSPNSSMRIGRGDPGGKTSRIPPAHRVLAHHLDRLAAVVTDTFEMRCEVFERHFLAHAEGERELAVEIRRLGPKQRGAHSGHRDRHALT